MTALFTLAPTAAEITTLLGCAGRATLLLAAAWASAAALRRHGAAARHRAWTLGVIAALAVPALVLVLPPIAVPWRELQAGAAPAFFANGLTLRGGVADTAPAWPLAVALTWALGSAAVLLRLSRGHAAARQVRRGATPTANPAWLSARADAAVALGLLDGVPLLRSATITSPVTIGVRRPGILLPAAADTWAPERLRAVLLHELGHVRRHDTRTQLLAQLTTAMYWWSPLAWLAAARLRAEREHACDDLVLAAGVRPSTYAEALLDVARSLAGAPAGEQALAGSAACMADSARVEARLRRVLLPSTPRAPLGAGLRLGAPAAAAALALALSWRPTPAAATPTSPPTAGTAQPPAPGGPRSWFGTPTVETEVDASVPRFLARDALDGPTVEAEVRRRMGDLQACYEQRLVERPSLAGRIEIHWSISPAGDVVEQCISGDTVHDPALTECVNALVRGSHYPLSGSSFSVSYPFEFEPAPPR